MAADLDTEESLLQELQVVESIYLDELVVSHGERLVLSITLHPATGHDANSQYVRLTLQLLIPPQYPAVAPDISVSNPRGLCDEQIDTICSTLRTLAEQGLGTPMLYELIETGKELLTASNIPKGHCVICLYDFQEGDSLTKTQCFHHFHSYCLGRYVAHSKEQNLIVFCPVCRETLTCDFSKLQAASPPLHSMELYIPDGRRLQDEEILRQIYERQLANGGIIDLEAEKNRYFISIQEPFVQEETAVVEAPDIQAPSVDLQATVPEQHYKGEQTEDTTVSEFRLLSVSSPLYTDKYEDEENRSIIGPNPSSDTAFMECKEIVREDISQGLHKEPEHEHCAKSFVNKTNSRRFTYHKAKKEFSHRHYNSHRVNNGTDRGHLTSHKVNERDHKLITSHIVNKETGREHLTSHKVNERDHKHFSSHRVNSETGHEHLTFRGVKETGRGHYNSHRVKNETDHEHLTSRGVNKTGSGHYTSHRVNETNHEHLMSGEVKGTGRGHYTSHRVNETDHEHLMSGEVKGTGRGHYTSHRVNETDHEHLTSCGLKERGRGHYTSHRRNETDNEHLMSGEVKGTGHGLYTSHRVNETDHEHLMSGGVKETDRGHYTSQRVNETDHDYLMSGGVKETGREHYTSHRVNETDHEHLTSCGLKEKGRGHYTSHRRNETDHEHLMSGEVKETGRGHYTSHRVNETDHEHLMSGEVKETGRGHYTSHRVNETDHEHLTSRGVKERGRGHYASRKIHNNTDSRRYMSYKVHNKAEGEHDISYKVNETGRGQSHRIHNKTDRMYCNNRQTCNESDRVDGGCETQGRGSSRYRETHIYRGVRPVSFRGREHFTSVKNSN
ncbi:E3 ubiquitin-protein ligase RNF25 [Bombina bombina]|uniref:E3 ubiquitin-protein ligase RNF25 n=1 Tax=Bombina bombina TaxID=8345 RepID=UPI00235B1BC2|nr:E3 ubiquitin-protein ligase RNF25 [Bombina bombina]